MAIEPISFTPSGNIKDIQYDSETQTLYIIFNSNRGYKYPNVTGEEAAGFSRSLSANSYLQSFIIPQHLGEQLFGDELAGLAALSTET